MVPHDEYGGNGRGRTVPTKGRAMNLHAEMAKKNHVGDADQSRRGNGNQEIGATHFGIHQGIYVADVSSVSHTVILLIRGALGSWRICFEASSYRNLAIFSAEGLIASKGA